MIAFAVFLFTFYQVSSFKLPYSELERLGGSCYPDDSCATLKTESEDHLWGKRTCECAEHCVRHNTCCVDSPHVGKSWQVLHNEETCQKVSTFPSGVLMVTKCSDEWEHEHSIREQCESIHINVEDPVLAAPVTSLETNITYKNSFCAFCNYDYGDDVAVWNIRVELPKTDRPSANITKQDFLENPSYDQKSNSWGVMKNNVFYGTKMRHKIPSDLKKVVKKCYPKMITQCDPFQSSNSEVQHRCASYYAPIKIKTDQESLETYYRNIHCAICNGVNVSEAGSTDRCKLDNTSRRKPSFSFVLLMDIGRGNGDLVGKKQLCKDNEKWDPFFKKCRRLICLNPGHVIKDGKCVNS